jgi:hypothetical protein
LTIGESNRSRKLASEVSGKVRDKSKWNTVKENRDILRRGSLQVDTRMAFKQKLKGRKDVLL